MSFEQLQFDIFYPLHICKREKFLYNKTAVYLLVENGWKISREIRVTALKNEIIHLPILLHVFEVSCILCNSLILFYEINRQILQGSQK